MAAGITDHVWEISELAHCSGNSMIYLKSLLVGVATMLLSAVLFTVGTIWWESRKINVPAATSVGWDIRALTQQPLFLLILILGFAAGFYWEFTRVSR
jgi:hypothetical protein